MKENEEEEGCPVQKLLDELKPGQIIYTADGTPCGEVLPTSGHLTADQMAKMGW